MNRLCLALAMLLAAGLPARAADDDAARAARWNDLKQAVFGNRPVADGAAIISLEAPARALDAATVPISISLPKREGMSSGRVAAVWILVDGNPSPLAGTFKFGPAADPRLLRTRVRVDQYTLIHAVAETEDGRLFATSSFVKAAGGCSAPSSKDPQVAMSRLGQMKVRLEGQALAPKGETTMVNLLISHPNNNGMQMDQVSRHFIPPRYIQDLTVRYGDELVLSVNADISLSEDPVITFGLRANGPGPLQVDMQDSTQAEFHQQFLLNERS